MPDPLRLAYDGHLSDELKTCYRDGGFLFPIQVVSAEQAALWRADLEEIEREWLAADLPHRDPRKVARQPVATLVEVSV